MFAVHRVNEKLYFEIPRKELNKDMLLVGRYSRAAAAQYASFFRLPDVTRLLAMAVLARMPLGTVTLGMLLHVRALTGSQEIDLHLAVGVAVLA